MITKAIEIVVNQTKKGSALIGAGLFCLKIGGIKA